MGPFPSSWPSLVALSPCSLPSSGRPEQRGIWGVDMVKPGPLGFAGPVMRSRENTWGDSTQSWAPLSKWHPHGDPRPQGINLWWERKRSNGHTPRCPQALGRYHGAGGSWVPAGAHQRVTLHWEGAALCGLLPYRLPNFLGNDESLINCVKMISNCFQFYCC